MWRRRRWRRKQKRMRISARKNRRKDTVPPVIGQEAERGDRNLGDETGEWGVWGGGGPRRTRGTGRRREEQQRRKEEKREKINMCR